jgi:ABC-2 type transport system ATP-binding protein
VHNPKLLILDEPASGLDPRARIELRELLKELRALGKTIMISSHILTELAEMCTHIGIIEAGRLLVAGDVNRILQSLQPHRSIEIQVLADAGRAAELLSQIPGVRDVRVLEPTGQPPEAVAASSADGAGAVETLPTAAVRYTMLLDFAGDEDGLARLLAGLIAAGVPVVHFAGQAGDLEDIFLHVTRGIAQ